MNRKTILWVAFIVVALVQLYVPAQMIWESEGVIAAGTAYKFNTAPVDPTDPFRGKYITLNYSDNSIKIENADDWQNGEQVYVTLFVDAEGFAQIKSVSREMPTTDADFLKTKIDYVSYEGGSEDKLIIDYPFNRFYMEESKAYDAELEYRKTEMDTSSNTYALVYIKNGRAVLKDVLVNGKPIQELVESKQSKHEEN